MSIYLSAVVCLGKYLQLHDALQLARSRMSVFCSIRCARMLTRCGTAKRLALPQLTPIY